MDFASSACLHHWMWHQDKEILHKANKNKMFTSSAKSAASRSLSAVSISIWNSKKKKLTEISNTLISSNSTSRSVLLVSGWDSQVKSLHLFFISNSKYQEHLEIPELRKILSNCCLFPCSLNCTISLCACWPQCLV